MLVNVKIKIGLFGSMQNFAQNSRVGLALVHTNVTTVLL
jgi:hypothetical protein